MPRATAGLGSNQTNLTNHEAGDRHPSWSTDGSKIAFRSLRDGNNEIYVMDADGSNQIRLTDNASLDAEPDWSPGVVARLHLLHP